MGTTTSISHIFASCRHTAMGIMLILASLLVCGCDNRRQADESNIDSDVQSAQPLPDGSIVVSCLRQNASVATTELTVRKVAIYDTSKSEHFSIADPSTWKYGDKKCIIPVEVTIKYGYDIASLTIEDVKCDKDKKAAYITLPRPKVIDAGYNTYIEPGSVTSISTGLRSQIGHALEEEIRRKAYESVVKQDLSPYVGDDIRANTEHLFTSLVKSLGYESVIINYK